MLDSNISETPGSHDHVVSQLAKAGLVIKNSLSSARGLEDASPSHVVEGLVDVNDTTCDHVSDTPMDTPLIGIQLNSSLVLSERCNANDSVQVVSQVQEASSPSLSPQVRAEIQKVNDWYTMVEEDALQNNVASRENNDLDGANNVSGDDMTLVLSKSQKRRLRKKQRESGYHTYERETIQTRARVAAMAPRDP